MVIIASLMRLLVLRHSVFLVCHEYRAVYDRIWRVGLANEM